MKRPTGAAVLLAILVVGLAWPTWQAAGLSSSPPAYFLWTAGESLIAPAVLVGGLALLWGRFRQVSTTLLVCGLISTVFGAAIWASAPRLFEQAAPELRVAGSATWTDTTIRELVSTARGRYFQSALAANVRLTDGSTIEALTTSRNDREGIIVELFQDRHGVYWVGDPERTGPQTYGVFLGGIGALVGFIGAAGKSRRIRAAALKAFFRIIEE
jgi:hypothetical protein